MILAVKSMLPLEKLIKCNFYTDKDMVYYKSLPDINWHYFIVNLEINIDKLIKELANDNLIIEFDFDFDGVVQNLTEVIPTNANFKNQWAFKNIGQYGGFPGEDARISQGWSIQTGSYEIVVAIIDSGVDVDHECLVGNIYIDKTETVRMNFDADGNGYKNDFMGWNVQKQNFKSYTQSHGTALASIITTNGYGMSGVCQKTLVMPIVIGDIDQNDIANVRWGFRGCGPDGTHPWEDTYTSPYNAFPNASFAEGIIYAAKKGAHIINIAASKFATAKIECCGTYPIPTYMPDVRDAIKLAGRYGCVVVSAAGDSLVEQMSKFISPRDGTVTYSEFCGGDYSATITGDRNVFPGAYKMYYPFMINVTAMDNWGYLYYSKTSDGSGLSGTVKGVAYSPINVDIAAPGQNILAALPNNKYGIVGGTSAASAFVAGTAALIWAHNPFLRNFEIVNIIKNSARKSAYWSGKVQSNGVLDVNQALRTCK